MPRVPDLTKHGTILEQPAHYLTLRTLTLLTSPLSSRTSPRPAPRPPVLMRSCHSIPIFRICLPRALASINLAATAIHPSGSSQQPPASPCSPSSSPSLPLSPLMWCHWCVLVRHLLSHRPQTAAVAFYPRSQPPR
jgi:hypothetical protein